MGKVVLRLLCRIVNIVYYRVSPYYLSITYPQIPNNAQALAANIAVTQSYVTKPQNVPTKNTAAIASQSRAARCCPNLRILDFKFECIRLSRLLVYNKYTSNRDGTPIPAGSDTSGDISPPDPPRPGSIEIHSALLL